MSTEASREVIASATHALAVAGFDLVWPFDARAVAEEVGVDVLLDQERPLGLLIGNTRALWPVFTAARAGDPVLAASDDPVDRYTEMTIERVTASIPDARVVYAHRPHGDAYLPFQRMAVAAGAGTSSPSQLVIHPVYGPWFALRAIVLCNGRTPQRMKSSAPCTCTAGCEEAFARALAATGPDRWRAWLAVRDACPIGREHRYSEEQILHHYSGLIRDHR